MRGAIGLLLQHPNLASCVEYMPELAEMAIPGIKLLLNIQHLCLQNSDITTAQLLEQYRETPEFDALKKLAVW